MRRCGKRVDDLTGTRVVQLFARLMLDRSRIVLQLIDMLLQAAVLCLELLHLDLKLARFLALIEEGRDPVVSEDHAVAHQDGKTASAKGGQLAAGFV